MIRRNAGLAVFSLSLTLFGLAACGASEDGGVADTTSPNDVENVNDAVADTAADPDAAGDTVAAPEISSTDTLAGPDIAVAEDLAAGEDSVDAAIPSDIKAVDTGPKAVDDFKELLVKILTPSGRDWTQNEGEKVQLAGIAFGGADSVKWSCFDGKNTTTGDAAGGTYWTSSIVTLTPGDNLITVTATKGETTASDSVHIVYNPLFSFDDAPSVSPAVLFVNESGKLVVHMSIKEATADVGQKSIIDPSSIKLIEVDSFGSALPASAGTALQDTGNGGNCDDVQKDSVFSTCLSISKSVVGSIYFRVTATATIGIPPNMKSYTVSSPLATVDVVPHFDKNECNGIVNLQKKVKSDYSASLAADGPKKAQAAAIAALVADSSVAQAGPASGDGFGVWVRYKTGRIGALNLAPADTRGGGDGPSAAPPPDSNADTLTFSVGTRRALAVAPFNQQFKSGKCILKPPSPATCAPECGPGTICAKDSCEFISTLCSPPCADAQVCITATDDEAEMAGAGLAARECPPFVVDAAAGSQAYLKYYRELSSYGVVAISGHGDVFFGDMDVTAKKALDWEHLGAQEVIWSGETVNCDAMSTSTKNCDKNGGGCDAGQSCVKTSMNGGVCVDHTQADIMKGRVVIGDSTYGITPAFLARHNVDALPQSIIYLGACRTMYNGSLAVQLFGAGAAAVVGYSGYVSNAFAFSHGWHLFDGLINKHQSVLQALNSQDEDPLYGSKMRMLGNSKANCNDANLINPSWDKGGKLTGWKPIGDGRVISRLGLTTPVGGKYMGIISTGLGFTTDSGSLEQPFCVASGATQLCYQWKFYSEEFIEYCGSAYMDRFAATLTDSGGSKITMTDVKIDQLCPYDCGGKTPCEAGSLQCKCGQQWKTLTNADLGFDQGGVWMTPWQKTCQDVSKLDPKKKVTLKFFASDTGDSIFDTVILLDEVTVK